MQRGPTVRAETGRAISDFHAHQRSRVEVAPPRQQTPVNRPIHRSTTSHVARSHHGVGAGIDGAQHARNHRRVVREVDIHRDHHVDVGGQHVRETMAVSVAETLFTRTMQHVDVPELEGALVGDPPRPIGTVVVGDHDANVGKHLTKPSHHRPQILGFVVRGQHHRDRHGVESTRVHHRRTVLC